MAKTKTTKYAEKHAREFAFAELHPSDTMQEQAKPITLRAGSLLIWSSELPHCNYPNDSDRYCYCHRRSSSLLSASHPVSSFRMVQYVKMFGSQEQAKTTPSRQHEVRRMLGSNVKDITPLGEKLLGLKPWE